jgi:hypothetical protein
MATTKLTTHKTQLRRPMILFVFKIFLSNSCPNFVMTQLYYCISLYLEYNIFLKIYLPRDSKEKHSMGRPGQALSVAVG